MDKDIRLHRIKICIYALMTAGVMLLIFLMSDEDAVSSTELSDGLVQTFIGRALAWMPSITGEGIGYDIRKYGHIAEYFLLGVSSTLLFGEIITFQRFDWARLFLSALSGALFCFAYACSDEYHQTFVEGRSGKFSDVGYDSIGYLTGTVLIFLFLILKKRKYCNKNGQR